MKYVFLIMIVFACSGCASAVHRHQALQQQLDMPVDCNTADHQIANLKNEKATGGEKFLNTLASVIPTSAIINLISGEYGSRWQIANGNFNKQAESRIALIEESCHISVAKSSTITPGSRQAESISQEPF